MTILVTGAAGFIGHHTSVALLERGDRVVGVDCLTDYYDIGLKKARLSRLEGLKNFDFHRVDVADAEALSALSAEYKGISGIVHLAAQAGVRYSLENPQAYVHSNVHGQVAMLEMARRLPELRHFVYASSSSVYGENEKQPFSIDDPVDKPVSLYAATKRADELISRTYSHLYGLPSTGLRFFTVYGPLGRPDMAYFIFTKSIIEERPIRVFNNGQMKRDFTEIDDIVDGILAALDRPATLGPDTVPHCIYNLGNHAPVELKRFIDVVADAVGKEPVLNYEPMQKGDVAATYADIEASTRDLGFRPTIPIEVGIPRFVEWYRGYYT